MSDEKPETTTLQMVKFDLTSKEAQTAMEIANNLVNSALPPEVILNVVGVIAGAVVRAISGQNNPKALEHNLEAMCDVFKKVAHAAGVAYIPQHMVGEA